MSKQKTSIAGWECFIYDCGSSDVLLIQPVDDHDIEVLDSEVAEIARLSEGKGFTLVAFRVRDWNADLSPWEAPPVFGEEAFAGGAEATLDYAARNTVKTGKVYLSLGDKEEKTRNPVMMTVGDNIRRQYELLQADNRCSKCTLEINPGNHFKEPDIRTAKGFAWLMR